MAVQIKESPHNTIAPPPAPNNNARRKKSGGTKKRVRMDAVLLSFSILGSEAGESFFEKLIPGTQTLMRSIEVADGSIF
ncbi:MAG: hypothetical protein QNK83_12255 [Akkermansiaceae bacterium]